MRRALVAAASLALSGLLAACQSAPRSAFAVHDAPPNFALPTQTHVRLIALNDFHGQLEPPPGSLLLAVPGDSAAASAQATQASAGGAAYLATLIKQLKNGHPNAIVVGAGDLIGASPLASAAFHDEPTIEALDLMGLAVSAVGNHEFDRGKTELLRLQNGGCLPPSVDGKRGVVGVDTCLSGGRFAGARFQYLAANVIDQISGQPLLPASVIKTVGDVKIGFIGLTLRATPTVVMASGVTGLRFADEVQTINALVPSLKAQGAAAIVVLLHQGGTTSARLANDDSCPGFSGEAGQIADQLDKSVDVVVSGHTHHAYVCTRPDGKLLTQAGSHGRMATAIDLTIDTGTASLVAKRASQHVAVNATSSNPSLPVLARDPVVAALVERTLTATATIRRTPAGTLTASITRSRTPAGESALGALLADAYLTANADPAQGGAQIALTNPGGMRRDLGDESGRGGKVDLGMLYGVLPFGNRTTTLTLSGAQLRRLLEQQWESPQPAGGRILQVSGGLTYSWDASRPEGAAPGQGERVIAESIKLNGRVIAPGAQVRVTVPDYLAGGGDHFSVLRLGLDVKQGPLDIEALAAYLNTRSPYSPVTRARITRVDGAARTGGTAGTTTPAAKPRRIAAPRAAFARPASARSVPKRAPVTKQTAKPRKATDTRR